MGASIYYFTGTGNSLNIAKKLTEMLHAQLLPIKEVLGENSITPEADCIGIVFPVYNHRIPYIIKRFADRLCGLGSKYIFAVCTFGDSPCIALEYLARLIRAKGGSLSCGFGIKMPYNYIEPMPGISGLFKPFVLRETTQAQQETLFFEAEARLEIIYDAVCAQKSGYLEIEYQQLEHIIDLMNLRELIQKPVWLKIGGYKGKNDLPYLESIQLMDYGFHTDEHCVRCGICEKVCPVGNIKIGASGPVWAHRCEQCFACLHWCPNAAIQYGGGTVGKQRYHHPSIALANMTATKIKKE